MLTHGKDLHIDSVCTIIVVTLNGPDVKKRNVFHSIHQSEFKDPYTKYTI